MSDIFGVVDSKYKEDFPELHLLDAAYDENLCGDPRGWTENILYDRRTSNEECLSQRFHTP